MISNKFNNSLRFSALSNKRKDCSPITLSHLSKQLYHKMTVISPEEALVKLTEQTKFPIMQENGQRIYGPPPDWKGPSPARGCEVFIGKIPRECFEDELVPIFQSVGKIYTFRLMMDFSGCNRGYGFCMYTNRDDTKKAVEMLDNYEIRKGKMLGVCLSVDNCRLFVGGIPKTKTKNEIMAEMQKITEGVKDVIVYPSAADKGKSRGFAFVEYITHKAAAMARRKLIPGRIQLWGHQIAVDWAEPEREVDEDVMSKVKILYVRNLMLTTTEDTLREIFTKAAGVEDSVERVKKIRDYAFVHFRERDQGARALQSLDNTDIESSRIEVTWAKPVEKSDHNRKNATKLPQLAGGLPPTAGGLPGSQLFLDPYLAYASLYAASNPQNQVSSGVVSPSGGLSRGLNGRPGKPYRNAAGSRSAGVRNGNIPGYVNGKDKKHPVQILNDLCVKSNWGSPTYSVINNEVIDSYTGSKVILYHGQVSIPGLYRQFYSPRLVANPDEAKSATAEYVLALLQYQPQPMDAGSLSALSMTANGLTAHSSGLSFLPTTLTPDANQLNALLYGDPASASALLNTVPQISNAPTFINPAAVNASATLLGSDIFPAY